jgi:tetratricopeptide (TPR) repeat protein
VDELDKFIEAAQGEPDLKIYFEAADQYLEKGQFQQAVGILNRAVNLGPKSWKAHAKLGQACLLWCKNGKKEVKEDAVRNLEKAVGLCNDEAEKQKIQALLQQAMKL